MDIDYSKKSVHRFLTDLGSTSSSPGGGSAAALVGAVGASLVEMVIGINEKKTLKKKKISKRKAAAAIARKTRRIRMIKERFLRLASDDVRAFLLLKKLYGGPQNPKVYQKALNKSAGIPLEMCHRCIGAMRLAIPEKNRTGRWLFSDLNEAALLLEAAFIAARLNVEINIAGSRERSFANKTRRSLDSMEKEAKRLSAFLRKG